MLWWLVIDHNHGSIKQEDRGSQLTVKGTSDAAKMNDPEGR